MKPHELLKLQDNWDSYGGKKPLPSCVAKAEELYFRLPGAWDFVPCSDGGVQLEQHINGFDIEICVSPAPVATPTASVCLRCHGTGAIDAATSADDPSCPGCDGEGVRQ